MVKYGLKQVKLSTNKTSKRSLQAETGRSNNSSCEELRLSRYPILMPVAFQEFPREWLGLGDLWQYVQLAADFA